MAEQTTFIHNGEHGELSARDIEDLSRLIPIFLDIKAKHRRNYLIQKAKQLRALDRKHAELEREG